MYISNGYRSGGEYYIVDISKPLEITKDMSNLLQKYYEDWKDLDPFEREARFHIAFIRIHP